MRELAPALRAPVMPEGREGEVGRWKELNGESRPIHLCETGRIRARFQRCLASPTSV